MVTVTRQQKGNRRYYTVEGDEAVAGLELPSVTTLTNVLDKPALVGWAERMGIEASQQYAKDNPFIEIAIACIAEHIPYDTAYSAWLEDMGATAKGITRRTRDIAGDKGTAIHGYIEEILSGSMPKVIPSEYDQAINNFAAWYKSSGIRNIQLSELPVYSSICKYGGTLDAIGRDSEDNLVLLDWKTSNGLYPETALQLAGYCQAYSEMRDLDPNTIRLVAVRLGKDRPDFEVKEVTNFEESFAGFLACKAIWEWNKTKSLV